MNKVKLRSFEICDRRVSSEDLLGLNLVLIFERGIISAFGSVECSKF